MKWRKGSEQQSKTPEIIELSHPSGPVMLRGPEARIVDEGVQIRGVVDAATWQRVLEQDIFGAATRERSPGRLADDAPLRLTLITDQDLPSDAVVVPAGGFTILEAMYEIDQAEIKAAGFEGQIWEGVSFSAARPWAVAVKQLAEVGFEPFEGLPSATTMRRESDGISVEFRHHDAAEVVQFQVVYALPQHEEVPAGVLEVVNGINSALPFSTTVIDAGDLLVRDTLPDALGSQLPGLIGTRVTDLVELMGIITSPLLRAWQGELTPSGALEAMFT